ncbi:hypothetical protein SAMD00019534_040440 [Acytostelium subglobosum LB1]|uniref:hypothetical protein n=1 Tax=Acytostelium subglobosum LB1 TaxID=1410327 RepID=UPI0006448A05|nr:hypothetical protein SAMD00019534_040440 [Acytostelium subglobosum LB1]GAM20869.1 hypothetical protein SAMD00019534_040440 [Acytostelium subglobosum LB1]|eukprot:XP_012756003.1 hypothetical protein SAMD00019534_040440 [Acytostelium subglobosum LB1]
MKKRIIVRFYVQKKVEYGQYLKITGSVPGLGYWSVDNGIRMQWTEGDWWIAEYQCEGALYSQPKNQFRLDPVFGLCLEETNNTDLLSSASSTPSSASSSTSSFLLNSTQSLSPKLKGVSPQFIDLEYKYVLFENYTTAWESERNHKVSFMVWSDPSVAKDVEDILIEIRDEWNGGNGVCPTLDFQSNQPIVLDRSAAHYSSPSTMGLGSYSPTSSSSSIYSSCSSLQLTDSEKQYCFLHPMDPHPVPRYPAQICTFIVVGEGNTDSHSVLLVSHFFGSEFQNSIQMIPIVQLGVPYTLWVGQLYAPQPIKFEYKYVVVSNNNRGMFWEKGTRYFSSSTQGPRLLINNDGPLRVSDASPSWIMTGLVGLVQTDFNCALVSVVQMLYHISPLKNVLLNLRGKIGFPYTQCLANIFTSMEMGSQTTELHPLQTMIGNCSDAAEILNIILVSLIEEVSRISQISSHDNIVIDHLFEGELTQTSIFVEQTTLDGQQQQQQQQGEITAVKTHKEKFVNIILPVRGYTSLESSFQSYKHNIEHYESPNTVCETTITMDIIPDIFIIQLDRTYYQSSSSSNSSSDNQSQQQQQQLVKLVDMFSFPKKFYPTDNNAQYNLKAIICHTGSVDAINSGHFFIYVRRGKQWYKCDGATILKVSQREAINDSYGGGANDSYAYILVYEKLVTLENR